MLFISDDRTSAHKHSTRVSVPGREQHISHLKSISSYSTQGQYNTSVSKDNCSTLGVGIITFCIRVKTTRLLAELIEEYEITLPIERSKLDVDIVGESRHPRGTSSLWRQAK